VAGAERSSDRLSSRGKSSTTATWIGTRTDQVIILRSSILGRWLIANSVNLILT
jgi:hypothetical protein